MAKGKGAELAATIIGAVETVADSVADSIVADIVADAEAADAADKAVVAQLVAKQAIEDKAAVEPVAVEPVKLQLPPGDNGLPLDVGKGPVKFSPAVDDTIREVADVVLPAVARAVVNANEPVACGDCGEVLPSRAALGGHRKGCAVRKRKAAGLPAEPAGPLPRADGGAPLAGGAKLEAAVAAGSVRPQVAAIATKMAALKLSTVCKPIASLLLPPDLTPEECKILDDSFDGWQVPAWAAPIVALCIVFGPRAMNHPKVAAWVAAFFADEEPDAPKLVPVERRDAPPPPVPVSQPVKTETEGEPWASLI